MKNSNRCIISAMMASITFVLASSSAIADAYFDQGVRLYQQRKYQAAARYFEQSTHDSPWDSTALYYAALCYHQMRNYVRAKELYATLIDKFPETTAALNATTALSILDPGYLKRKSSLPSSSTGTATIDTTPTYSPQQGQANLPQQSRVYYTKQGESFLIDAQINNRNIKMIFDTGASTTVIGKNHLQQLGLTPPGGSSTGKAAGVGSTSTVPTWNMNVDVKVGDILKRGYPIVVQDTLVGEPLLGQTFFNDFTYTIDNGAHSILFQRKEGGRASSSYQVPFKREGTHLIVSVDINGKSCDMIFDTGAESCSFTKQQAKQAGLKIPEDAETGTSQGISGSTSTSWFPVKRMKLGPIDKANVQVGVVDESAMGHPLLGQNFFNDWQYTIDNGAGVIRFMKR